MTTSCSAIFRALLSMAAAVLAFVPLLAEEKPVPRLSLIFAERFRFEAWDNAVHLDRTLPDSTAYTRTKTTFGLSWRPSPKLEVTGKLTNEFRIYVAPKDRPFTWHEAFFDNLYVKWRIPGRLPLTLSAGRMDIFLGEGFVIADGTPLDGSRSFYFNALRLDWDPAPGQSLMVFVHAMDKTDRFLPVLRDRDQPLVEQPERAAVVYYSGSFRRVKLDAYFIRKGVAAPDPGTLRSRINTWGARVQVPAGAPLQLTAEAAAQTGSYGAAGRSAFGAITHLDYSPIWRVPYVRTLTLGGIFLSGDRPETEKQEGWDPLFSRWPKWSEGYIYTFINESRIAYWSNLTSVYAALLLDFGPRANMTLTLHRLGAQRPPAPGTFPGGAGLDRGVLLVGRLNYTISRRLSGHFEWDRFDPGGFYRAGASGFNWLRFELLFKS